MNKTEFLRELEKELKKINKKEYKNYISYYDELIEDYKEDGNSEDEAIEKIGNPKDIANNNIEELNNSAINSMTTSLKVVSIILIILGSPLWGTLVLCVLCLILSLFILIGCAYLLIWCIPFMTAALGVASSFGGIISVVLSVFAIQDGIHIFLFQLGAGLLITGIGVLVSLFTLWISKKFINITKRFTKKIVELFEKRRIGNEI